MSPTATGVPSLQPSNPPSVSAEPTSQPSTHPSASDAPSSQPSMAPSLSTSPTSQPSSQPSLTALPTALPSHFPSYSTSPSAPPSSSPSESLTLRKRVPNPCVDTDEPLVDATVTLYGTRGTYIDSTKTGADGYYEFSGLPLGRYSIQIEYVECPSFAPSTSPTVSSSPSFEPSVSLLPTAVHSSKPSYSPSAFPSISSGPTEVPSLVPTAAPINPTSSPTRTMVVRQRAPHPCFDDDTPLVGATATLYNAFGQIVDQTVTDSEGYYTFEGLPIGRYATSVEYPSCDTSQPSLPPSMSSKPTQMPSFSTVPSSQPSVNPTDTRSLSPSISGIPTLVPSDSPSVSMPPSNQLSQSPSTSAGPSEQPSLNPTSSKKPTTTPSYSPTESTSPSLVPTAPINPTSSPTRTMVVRQRATNPCYDDDTPLVGATVTLYNAFNVFVDQTVTDSEGYYTFTGLPIGRYRTQVDYPDCGRRELYSTESFLLSRLDNDAIKFYKNGEMCDASASLGGWASRSTADSTHFDTLDECCANVFWYDIDGCFSRSRVAFQFEICVDISGFVEHSNCPLDEIQAIERVMQQGLGNNSELALVEFGSAMLTNIGGETKCIGPTLNQDLLTTQLRGLADPNETTLNVCGVVVTKEAECREEGCLKDSFDRVEGPFREYFDNGEFASALHSFAEDNLHPLLGLRAIEVVGSSFATRKLLLPSTVTSSKPIEDEATLLAYSATTADTPRFYPTYISGQLCHSKTLFDSWEESFGTLKECCESFFSWDYDVCCSSLNMGGC
ncbi:hypothetical protein ACHAXR_007451 [Thalassiosira sp. AJA248-18]